MKVLDLQCSHGHSFEGWFASQDDYDGQRARGLVTCPLCNDADITKMLSAPRLNLGQGGSGSERPSAASTEPSETPSANTAHLGDTASGAMSASALPAPLQAAWLQMVRRVMANTEDVGPQFAQEARKIHYGETAQRSIRGQASREETEALIDEGIDILPLPVPDALKEPLQ